MIDPDYLTSEWTTVAVNPAPPGLIAVYEDTDGFSVVPCYALLLQERLVSTVETRVIAACFETLNGGGAGLYAVDSPLSVYDDDDLFAVTTVDQWEVNGPSAEFARRSALAAIGEQVLAALRDCPEGRTESELRALLRFHRASRVTAALDALDDNGKMRWTRERRPDDPDTNHDGKVPVGRLANVDGGRADA